VKFIWIFSFVSVFKLVFQVILGGLGGSKLPRILGTHFL
jgi:hypothetical protein